MFLLQPQPIKPTIAQKPQISPKPRLGDTIEMTLPLDVPATGLQTWPLKNRVISTETVKKTMGVEMNHHQSNNQFQSQYTGASQLTSNVTNIDHQVALEEKKLINALKNGDLVNDEPRSTIVGRRENSREVSVRN